MATENSLYTRLLEYEAHLALQPFWARIAQQLDTIETSRPTTSNEILRLLGSTSDTTAFFGGSGGDRELLSSLTIAGWEVTEYHAAYYWTAQHPTTGESLEYIEGDVYNRTDG